MLAKMIPTDTHVGMDVQLRLLEIYLADHVAAATAGAALARRAAGNNAASEFGEFLSRLSTEIEEDRQTLRRVVAELGFEASSAKVVLAWVAEKAARMKLNGRLRGYSPLSRVVELETLSVGIAGKLALWQTLQQIPGIEQHLAGIDLERLIQRATRQRVEAEEHRVEAAQLAFAQVERA